MPKICLVSPYPPEKYGISEYCKSLAEELAKLVSVVVLAGDGKWAKDKKETINGVLVKRTWRRNSPLMPIRLVGATLNERPDAVHIQYESYGLYGALEFLSVPLLLLLLRLLRIRVFITLHSLLEVPNMRTHDFDYLKASSLGKLLKYSYQIARMTVNLAFRSLRIHFIVHSELLRSRVSRTLGLAGRNVAVLPIGCAIPKNVSTKSEARELLGLTAEKIILFFGFISGSKNIHDLIAAMPQVLSMVPNCLTIISGIPSSFDPSARGYYEKLREQAKWTNRIVFTGRFVSPRETELLFSAADTVVLPHGGSFSSGVLSLALTYGVPVVVASGGIAGLDVRTNSFGLIYQQGNVEDLANQITSLFLDSDLAASLTANSRKTLSQRSWDVIARNLLGLYGLSVHREGL